MPARPDHPAPIGPTRPAGGGLMAVLPAGRSTLPALPLHDSQTARELEQAAAASLPPHTLMQRAGQSVARLGVAVAPHAHRIWILAGPGNNGGDGFEAAWHLATSGHRVGLSWLGTTERLPPDAAMSLARARDAGVAIDTQPSLPADLTPDDLIIDALLGRGLGRAVEGPIAAAIEAANHSAAPVLAVDLPSGLPSDSGALPPGAPCVQARWTLALLSLAPGLFTAAGRDQVGDVWWDDLGVDTFARTPAAWLGGPGALAGLWPRRRHVQHKGSFGDVWVVAGARSMGGAALLAGRAAVHAGAGRVYVHRLDPAAEALDPQHPELMFAALPSARPDDPLGRSTVVAGCGASTAIKACLPELLNRAGRLVLDADALNLLAPDAALQQHLQRRRQLGLSTVITPHPLEAARLLGGSVAEVQADRLAAARRLAERFGVVIVLKGSGSVIAAPGETAWINPSGNAALATPGSGDVLAGWLGGLWSQCAWSADPAIKAANAWLAARTAVWSHGAAAEQASPQGWAWPASALIEHLRGLAPTGRP